MTAAPVQKPAGEALDSPTAPIELRTELVSAAFRRLIPRDFARQHLIVSQGRSEGTERLAISESTDRFAVLNARARLQAPVHQFVHDAEEVARVIDEAYGRPDDQSAATGRSSRDGGGIDELLAAADRDLLNTQGKGPIIKLVDVLLFEALGKRASDVHVQPLADRTLVRYRLDGVLHTAREMPRQLTESVISRIKVMGRMDIAERRTPQDGRATVTIGSGSVARPVDLRISTLPTSYGERAVVRLLDNSQHRCDFAQLGMPESVARDFIEAAGQSNGIILVTGPTGSGKTTTLYATLRRIGNPGVNVMTIEDPIEYELATTGLAISQSQINPRKGVTFATGLRHILRQDPDVIMVGEIRDAETARIAVQSSLTGHLVLSTLHTNDAPSAVTRLVDLGIEPYLVSASLAAVLAQRLVRTVHGECGGHGCEACFETGFSGRIGIFELLQITEELREMVATGASRSRLRVAARRAGMRTLRETGEQLVQTGRTTELELQRVVHAAEPREASSPTIQQEEARS